MARARRLLLVICWVLVGVGFAGAAPARADRLGLELGFLTKGYFPAGGEANIPFGGLGFSGQVNYEIEHWGFGARSFGTISNHNSFHLKAQDYDVAGDLSRRQFGLEAYARYFLLDPMDRKRWYLEFGFISLETEFVSAQSVINIPQSPNYERLFLRGAGFSLAWGYRSPGGHFFAQFGYELDHYDQMLIVGEVKYLHPVLADPVINQPYFIHSVLLMVGVDVFSY